MKRMLLVLGLMMAAPVLTLTDAQALPGNDSVSSFPIRKSSPEIDPMVGGSILTFLAGGMFLMDGRLRKKSRARK